RGRDDGAPAGPERHARLLLSGRLPDLRADPRGDLRAAPAGRSLEGARAGLGRLALMPRPRGGKGTGAPALFVCALVLRGLAAGPRDADRPQAPSAAGVTPSPRSAGPAASAGIEADDVPTRANTRRAADPGGRKPILWLGLDGLDWELLGRLGAEGRVANRGGRPATGWTARLQSFSPPLSPIVWTSIATGVGPEVHRVLDFQEVDPASGERVPISGRSRAVPAIWNLASSAGESVGVVGWWATHPAEEVT